ncbi:recombination repair protein 1-like isoform X1 [Uloborus diversus]|uniref:recombination repair protein 1-like isoform X1 n=1 Tax=Uloborus diversus TaxID=327109 RepID=UPI002409D2C5|nr:recombination repair protein 1-like isoform X1 [Uloborus diversus]
MSRSGMKRKNVDNGLLENLENSAANPCNTNGPSVVRRGRSKKKDIEDAASNASDANEKTMELPASRQRKNVKEQGIKGGEISTNGDSKAESGTKSTDEVLNPKKRGKTKNNRIEGNLKVADINEESAPVEESEADIAPNLTKPNAVEESKGILQNGSAFSNNAIDPSEESKKPNKRGRKKKLDEKTGAENGKTAEPETEKEDPVVEKLPVKRGRKNLKSTKITEGDSTESVKAATNEKVVPDVKDDENVDDKIKNIVPEKRGRKKVEQIPKEETAKATTKSNSKEKKVKSNENIASKKKHNVPALLDEPLIQENSNNEELLEIETKTNEPADKKKKKNAAKKCPTVDLKDCSVMLKRNENTENALQELASIPLQKKSDEDKSKITKSAEDQDNGESSKGKNKRGQDGSEDDFKPTKPAKVPKKATKSSEPKNIAKTPGIEKLDFSNKSTNSSGKPWNFKISSWNINGVRAWLEKDGLSYINHEKPDIIALQETKCSDDKLPEEVTKIDGYHCYWVAGDKDGYSGVGLLSKQEPIEVKYGIGIDQHDNEGRVITTEYENFFCCCCLCS